MRVAALSLVFVVACSSSAPGPEAADAASAAAPPAPEPTAAPATAPEPAEPAGPTPPPPPTPEGAGADGAAGPKEPPADAPPGGPPELIALCEEVDQAKAKGDADACMEKITAVSALTRKLHALGPAKEGPRVDALLRAIKAFESARMCLLAANRCDDAVKVFNMSTESYDKGTLPPAAVHALLNADAKKTGSTCTY